MTDSDGTKKLTNLTSSSNRAAILFATDEWFATAENLLNPAPPIFVTDLFCEQGKVMDGWETRRRREAGHDWCIVKLSGGLDGEQSFQLSMVELDTGYFTGNQTPRVSIEAMRVTRPDSDGVGNGEQHENEDYLYEWMPGASTRLARGGKGIRGTGQSPPTVKCALEACKTVARKTTSNPNGEWLTILPMTTLQPGYEESRYHHFEILDEVKSQIESLGGVTHLKLNYYPDGGVARMKVLGYPCQHAQQQPTNTKSTQKDESNTPTIHSHSSPNPPPSTQHHPYPELSSELHGGIGLACSNKHYGIPSNLLRPHLGKDMGDGWETARHPDRPAIVTKDPVTGLQDTPLMDWSVIKLGLGGVKKVDGGGGVSRIIVDTRHFKGNFPESVTIDGCYADSEMVSDEEVCASAGEAGHGSDNQQQEKKKLEWFPLLKRTPLTAHAEHEFLREHGHLSNRRRGVTHARISITPDGGLSRVRIYGTPERDPVEKAPRSHL